MPDLLRLTVQEEDAAQLDQQQQQLQQAQDQHNKLAQEKADLDMITAQLRAEADALKQQAGHRLSWHVHRTGNALSVGDVWCSLAYSCNWQLNVTGPERRQLPMPAQDASPCC